MSKDKQIRSRFGSNLAESMGAGRASRAGGDLPSTPAPSNGPSRHDGCARLRAAAEIDVKRITPDPDQPRTEFDPESITRLAESFKSHGQLQPLTVRWAEELGSYVIVTGERRWRAAVEAGRAAVACLILEGDRSASEILELQLIENALREDLKPIEQASAFRTLMDRNGWTAQRLAEVLHLNVASVTRALALLDLPATIQDAVEQGVIAPSTAYEVSKLDDAEAQAAIAERVVQEGLNRAETIEAVRQAASTSSSTGRRRRPEKTGGKAGRGGGRKVTERVLRASNGYKATINCRRGIDPVALLEAFEQWADLIRSEIESSRDGRAA